MFITQRPGDFFSGWSQAGSSDGRNADVADLRHSRNQEVPAVGSTGDAIDVALAGRRTMPTCTRATGVAAANSTRCGGAKGLGQPSSGRLIAFAGRLVWPSDGLAGDLDVRGLP